MYILILDLLGLVGTAVAVHRTSIFERHFTVLLSLFLMFGYFAIGDFSRYMIWPSFEFIMSDPWRPGIARGMVSAGVWYSVFRCKDHRRPSLFG